MPSSSGAPGRLYLDLTDREWAILDYFEDSCYSITSVKLVNGRTALAYVWPKEPAALETDWIIASISPERMSRYVEDCQKVRREFEAKEAGGDGADGEEASTS